jgi:hypothetical protein
MKKPTRSQWLIISIIVAWMLFGCGGTAELLKSGHWEGKTDNNHWTLSFDSSSEGQLSNVGIKYYDTFNNPCSFTLKTISLDAGNSFDQEISYADLESAVGVQGSISGKLKSASTISGKLTVSMCGRTFFFYEEDLPWTAELVQP